MGVPFATSNHGVTLSMAAKSYRPSIATLGESHGQQYFAKAMYYALWRHYHADVVFDPRQYASGGQCFAVGGTLIDSGANNMINVQLPQFALRPADVAFIFTGYNDTYAAHEVPAFAAKILDSADFCLANGAKAVVLTGQTPRGVAGSAYGNLALNNILRNACSRSAGRLHFLDLTDLLVDPTRVDGLCGYSLTGNVFLSKSTDGTHWSNHSCRLIGERVAGILRKLAPERPCAVQTHPSGTYDPASTPYGNLLGNAGMMVGTGGQYNYADNANVAGVSAASRYNITDNAALTGTPTIVTGPQGERVQRVTLGGTGGGGNAISFGIGPTVASPNNGDATRMMRIEAEIKLTAVTGLGDLYLRLWGSPNLDIGFDGDQTSGGWPDAVTETLRFYTTYPMAMPAAANPYFSFQLGTRSGVTPSGTVDFSRFSVTLMEP